MSSSLQLEQFLPYRLSLLSNMVSRSIAQHYQEKHGLSTTQWRVIAVLRQFSSLTATQLVERTAMDKVAIHRAVRGLIERGLLLRRAASDDRRRQWLSLSEEGIALHSQVAPKAIEYEQQLLSCLADADRQQLEHIISQLTEHASQLEQQWLDEQVPASGTEASPESNINSASSINHSELNADSELNSDS